MYPWVFFSISRLLWTLGTPPFLGEKGAVRHSAELFYLPLFIPATEELRQAAPISGLCARTWPLIPHNHR